MSVKKIFGLVLKEQPQGETGKRITVLAKGMGKVFLSAKGARKPKSKFLAGTQLFCYGEYQVYEGRGFYSVTQIDTVETFYTMRTDMERFAYGAFLLELVERTCQEGMEQDDVLLFVLRTFWKMTKNDFPPKLGAMIFCLKFLELSGFMPEMETCAICGMSTKAPYFFSVSDGGVVCQEHAKETLPLSVGGKKAMEYIFSHEGNKLFQFRLSPAVLEELDHIVEQLIPYHLNLELKSREFLHLIS